MTRTWNEQQAVAGATVAIDHGAPWGGLSLYRIERVTRTQVHIRGRVLDRATGRIRGGSPRGAWCAFMPTEADLMEAHRQALAERMRTTNWRSLDYPTLCAVADALPKTETTPEEPR